jgi:hypothetical protein
MAKPKKVRKTAVTDVLRELERSARLQALADSGGRKANRASTFKGADRKGRKAARGRTYTGYWG